MERKILLSKSYKVILKYMDKTAGSTASSMAMAALACQSRLRYLNICPDVVSCHKYESDYF